MIEDDELFKNFTDNIKDFSFDKNFKIVRCLKLLKDIQDENDLATLIEKEHLRNNHRGISENYLQLKEEIFHPKLKRKIQQFINNCDICNAEKYERKPIRQSYQLTITPGKPKEIIHCDVYYSLNKTLFCTFIDKFSKHAQAYKIQNRSWVELKKALIQFISVVGTFDKLVVDNELGFKAIPFRNFLAEQNIELSVTSNKNHTSNADIERLHNTINEHLRILRHDENTDIDTVEEKLFKIITFYNNSIHSTTQRKPNDFFYGVIDPNEYPTVKQLIEKKKINSIEKLNKTRENVEIEEGMKYIKEDRGGKNHSKFKKLRISKIDDNHFITPTNHKYYKSFIKRKKKFQNVEV